MITSSRILIGTIVAFVVVVAGFAIGLHFYKLKQSHSIPQAAQDSAPKAEKITVNHNVYDVSPPSTGMLLETRSISIVPDNGSAHVKIPIGEADAIKTGQKVFLYQNDGELLDSLGEITSVSPSADGEFLQAVINLSHNPEVKPEMVAKGKIIINREQNAQRLPYSALVRNEKGETYVWEVVQDENGVYTAYFKRVEITAGNDVVFALGRVAQTSNLFILNPDEKLREKQKVNTQQYMYKPPSQYEDKRIESLVALRTLRADPMPKNADAVLGPSKCPQPPGAAQAFINKIKTLSAAQPPAAAAAGCPQSGPGACPGAR